MPIAARKLGDALVNPIGFGAMGFAIEQAYGKIENDEDRLKLLDAVYAAGSTHWDSADVYGDSEDIIGKWFKRTGKRSEIFLATKFGITGEGMKGSPGYLKQQCYKSLERLGVDYIDLYYQHRTDPTTPIEVTVKAMAELVKEGKVKYLGLSECSVDTLRRAHAVHPITAIEVEYSPLVLDIEKDKLGLLKVARELGVKIVAYSPLARGLITGQITSPDQFEPQDCRRDIEKFSAANFPKILKVVDQIREIGKKHGATPGQVALAWVLAQGDDFHIIPGTKKIKYLEENIGAGSVVLSTEEVAAIRKIAEEADTEITGDRFAVGWTGFAYVDTPPLQTLV